MADAKKAKIIMLGLWITISNILSLPGFGNNTTANSSRSNQLDAHAIQSLNESPELPQLPAYSGKAKFVRGSSQAAEKGWINYQVSYLAKESPEQVIDWYQNVLKMYQWTILHSNNQTITANSKDGHMCTIIVNNTKEPGYSTDFLVQYNLAPKQPNSSTSEN